MTSRTADYTDDNFTAYTDNDSTMDDDKGLFQAAHNGDLERVDYYLRKGVSPNVKSFWDETPLHLASGSGHEAVALLLLEKGAEIDAKNRGGSTPLHLASDHGHEAVAKVLLAKGAEVNAKTNDGSTPLHGASIDGHEAVAALLLAMGAKVDAEDKKGRTPLHWASKYGHEIVATLLLKKGAEVDATGDFANQFATHRRSFFSDGWTPLHRASIDGHEAVAKVLLEKGANFNAKNHHGSTPLHLASMFGHDTVAALLLESGAKVNAEDYGGHTPLHWARLNEHQAAVTLLLEWGAEADNADSIPQHHATNEIGQDGIAVLSKNAVDFNTNILPHVTPFESSQNGTEEVVATVSIFDQFSGEDDGVSEMTEGSHELQQLLKQILATRGQPRKKQKLENSLPNGSEIRTSIPSAPPPPTSLASVLLSCRIANLLLQIQAPTAAINESLTIVLHDIQTDLIGASQVISNKIQPASSAAERRATTSPNIATLLANCRVALKLQENRILTPTPAISSSLQLLS